MTIAALASASILLSGCGPSSDPPRPTTTLVTDGSTYKASTTVPRPLVDEGVAPTPTVVAPSTSPATVPITIVGTVGTTKAVTTVAAAIESDAAVPTTSPRSSVVRTPPAGVSEQIMQAWGPVHGPQAVAVARCESGLRPDARNGPHAGLFQVNRWIHERRIKSMGFTPDQMFDAGPNIAVAHALWLEQGWRPWTCRRVLS